MEGQLTQWRRILTRAGFTLRGTPEEQERALAEFCGVYNKLRAEGHRHMMAVELTLRAAVQAILQHRATTGEESGADVPHT